MDLPDKFFPPRSRHRSREENRVTVGSITSDGGTGDELTLPHDHNRAIRKRFSARIRRSRQSSRSPFRKGNRTQSVDDDSLPRQDNYRKSPKPGRSKSGRKQRSKFVSVTENDFLSLV